MSKLAGESIEQNRPTIRLPDKERLKELLANSEELIKEESEELTEAQKAAEARDVDTRLRIEEAKVRKQLAKARKAEAKAREAEAFADAAEAKADEAKSDADRAKKANNNLPMFLTSGCLMSALAFFVSLILIYFKITGYPVPSVVILAFITVAFISGPWSSKIGDFFVGRKPLK